MRLRILRANFSLTQSSFRPCIRICCQRGCNNSQVEDLPRIELDGLSDKIFDLEQALVVLKVLCIGQVAFNYWLDRNRPSLSTNYPETHSLTLLFECIEGHLLDE